MRVRQWPCLGLMAKCGEVVKDRHPGVEDDSPIAFWVDDTLIGEV
ncbi:unnamed protein product [Acidithrix sp. C25]|nr:unnamed protein product [Acidithrix sp. C25]